jgi:hypothetical protein
LVTALHEGVETRTQIQLDLLDLQAWDLVHYAYSEVHSLGHALMHLEDAQFADLDQTGLGPQALRLMQTVDPELCLDNIPSMVLQLTYSQAVWTITIQLVVLLR